MAKSAVTRETRGDAGTMSAGRGQKLRNRAGPPPLGSPVPDRRRVLVGGVAAGLAAGLPAFAAAPLPAVTQFSERLKGTGTVRVASAGGALSVAQRKALFEPFEALSGIHIVETEGFSSAQVKSQVDSRAVQWDALGLEYSNVLDLEKQGTYFEPLDYDVIGTDGIPANQVHKNGLGYLTSATVIAYRTDAFGGRAPRDYKDFWDLDAFPGPRSWMSGAIGICPFIEGALLADGVPKDKLYPLDVPRAFASLTKIRDSIVKFWESGAQSAQMMADDETVMATAWNGRMSPLAAAGRPVSIQWDGAMFQTDNWVVPKGAENRANAMKFIAFASLPEAQARLSALIDYGFTNMRAAEFLPADRIDLLPSAHLDQGFDFDSAWWGANKSAVVDAFTEWSLG